MTRFLPRSLLGQVMLALAAALLIAQAISATMLYRAASERRELAVTSAASFQLLVVDRLCVFRFEFQRLVVEENGGGGEGMRGRVVIDRLDRLDRLGLALPLLRGTRLAALQQLLPSRRFPFHPTSVGNADVVPFEIARPYVMRSEDLQVKGAQHAPGVGGHARAESVGRCGLGDEGGVVWTF